MQATTPFFTNDLAGALKLIGTFGAMILLIAGIFVKWGQSPFSKRLDKLESDLDGVGRSLNSVKTDCTTSVAKHDELRDRVNRKEVNIEQILTEQGKHDASLSGIEKQQHSLQGTMLVMLNDALGERDKEITDLKVAIGKLQERDNTRQIVREMLLQTKDG